MRRGVGLRAEVKGRRIGGRWLEILEGSSARRLGINVGRRIGKEKKAM